MNKINTKELLFSVINLSHVTTHVHLQYLSRFSHDPYVKGRSKEKEEKRAKSSIDDTLDIRDPREKIIEAFERLL